MIAKIFSSLHQKQKVEAVNSNTETSLFCTIICNGKTKLSDKNSSFKSEARWLQTNINPKSDCFKAIVYYDNDDGRVDKSGNSQDFDQNQQNSNSQNNKHAKFVTDLSKLVSSIDNSKEKNDKILLSCAVRNIKEEVSRVIPPYTFYDRLRDRFYSMVIDGELEKTNLMFRLPGFIDWLTINRPDMLYNESIQSSEYLMLWLVKCIQNSNGDILDGLRNGLTAIFNHKIGGQFNLLFSDGSGVFAFSTNNESKKILGNISYKIIRNEHSIYSYIIRNSNDIDDDSWISIKNNSIYYFPVQGALQNYINIDTVKQPEVKLNKCINYVCLSLMSC